MTLDEPMFVAGLDRDDPTGPESPGHAPASAEALAVISAHAAHILESGALGRSRALEALLRFLLAATLERRSPKELEIADVVFGRSVGDLANDASVRVHVYRLRRKLDGFYAGPARAEPVRLDIPKGSYRLVLCRNPAAERVPEAPLQDAGPVGRAGRLPRRVILVLCYLASLAVAVAATWYLAGGGRDRALDRVRHSVLWAPVLANGGRVSVILGDYYIFGERDDMGEIRRLIRAFDINSARDLEQLAAADPRSAAQFADLSLHYLPLGTGEAVRAVAPVIRGDRPTTAQTRAFGASELNPEFVKHTNLVYVGYLSGLGSLRDPLFSGSRFAVGTSYDEIVDRQTGRRYLASSHLDVADDRGGRDYALISSFAGINGNRVVVIAGTRDAALMQAADFATRSDTLAALASAAAGRADFDALIEVESLRDTGLRAKLVTLAPRLAEADWSPHPGRAFPDQLGDGRQAE
jgi:hypothetical protein